MLQDDNNNFCVDNLLCDNDDEVNNNIKGYKKTILQTTLTDTTKNNIHLFQDNDVNRKT